MTTDDVTKENQIVTQAEAPETALEQVDTSPQAMMQIISRAAADPNMDVEKMERLLDVQERMMAKQAEINFTQDLVKLQAVIPRIKKNGKGVHGVKYAKYEDIDKAIRPLLIDSGFSLRYNSRDANGRVIITGTLSHKDGHSITDEIPLDIDKGSGRSSVQAVGSTISYGKRYLVGMLLNLVFEGEDDDGQTAGFIPLSQDQAAEIKKLLQETGADVKQFLNWVGAPNVDEMDAKNYQNAVATLKRKLQKSAEEAKPAEEGAE